MSQLAVRILATLFAPRRRVGMRLTKKQSLVLKRNLRALLSSKEFLSEQRENAA